MFITYKYTTGNHTNQQDCSDDIENKQKKSTNDDHHGIIARIIDDLIGLLI